MIHVYLAHPLSAPTKEGVLKNIQRAKLWYKWACLTYPQHCFHVSWIVNCEMFEDTPENRKKGMERNFAMIELCSEFWAIGSRITKGVLEEAFVARTFGLRLQDFTNLVYEILNSPDLNNFANCGDVTWTKALCDCEQPCKYPHVECDDCGEVLPCTTHLVGTGGQPREFFGCESCADENRDGTV